MKKLTLNIIAIMLYMFIGINVYAASFNSSLIGNSEFTDSITLELQVNQLSDFSDTCGGLCGFVGELEYDSEKIELVSISALNGFDLTQGKKIVLFKEVGVSSGSKIMTLKFKNKSLSNNEETTIKINNILASDGDNDIKSSNISKKIKYVTKNEEIPKEENNKPTTPTNTEKPSSTSKPNTSSSSSSSSTNKNNTTQKPASNTNNNSNNEEKKSSNNNLIDISLSSGDIQFSKDILVYDVIINDTDEINITAEVEDSKAGIDGLGKHKLNVGTNKIELVVTAEDGSKKTYVLNIVYEGKEENKVIDNSENDDNTSNDVNKKNYTLCYVIVGIISLLIIIFIFIYIKKNSDKKTD